MTSVAWIFMWSALAVLMIIAVAEFLLLWMRGVVLELQVRKLRREVDAGDKKGDVDEESDVGTKGKDGGYS